MVILRTKSFPGKLGRTRDCVDKEIVKFLNKEGIRRISYRQYKYMYAGVVLFYLFKKFHKVSESKKKDSLLVSMIIGKYETEYEKNRKNFLVEYLFFRYFKENAEDIKFLMRKEHKGTIRQRYYSTVELGRMSAKFCGAVLGIRDVDKKLTCMIVASNIFDDLVEYKEMKDLKVIDRVKLQVLYLKEFLKNAYLPIENLKLLIASLKVGIMVLLGAFQPEEVKEIEKEIKF